MRRSANISKDGRLRYSLRREWGPGGQVCFIGLNPSTADHEVDDPTVRRWIHFARAWGYGSFVAVNLFPHRTSSPKECKESTDWETSQDWYLRDEIVFANLPVVIMEAKKADLVVVCWGAGLWEMAQLIADEVVEEITCGAEPWPDLYCFGLTKNGSPIHPMARGRHRVADEQTPILFKRAFAEVSP